ncbi:choice-of-anchor L domain-containing protein, partial [Flavobacterium plurextorum]
MNNFTLINSVIKSLLSIFYFLFIKVLLILNKLLKFNSFSFFINVFFLFNISSSIYAQATIVTNPSNLQINTALNGPGIVIVGGTLSGGAAAATLRANQVATFSNGISGAGLQIPSGVYFTTGSAPFELANKNTAVQKSFNPAGATTLSDPNLSLIDPTATRDLVSYSFTITLAPNVSGLLFSYQFGSEEFPDYVGSNFDDAFGFFVSGPGISGVQNFATLPNGNVTSINKVNSGIPGFSSPATPVAAYDGSQSALYINNGHITTTTGGKYNLNTAPQPGPFPIFTEHNGLTKSIKKSIAGLTPGGTYTFKIVIADAGDASLDSGVFLDIIEGIISADLSVSKTVNNPSPNVGSNVVFTLTAGNTGPGNAPNTKITDLLPAGYTFVSATPSVGTYDSSTGVWDIGLLNISSSPTLQITATVKAAGPYLNSASIASPDIADPTPGNNTSSVTPTPVAQSNVGITKTASSATPNVGSNVTFTLTATNAGPSA